MRTLWRSTASLFRRYPILWMPQLAALVLSFFFGGLLHLARPALMEHTVHWLSQQHSVLGSATEYASPTQAIYTRAELYLLPFDWCFRLINMFLFTAALVATAGLLRSLAATGQPSLQEAASSVTSSIRRILGYSLKLLALSIPVTLILRSLSMAAFNLQKDLGAALTLSPQSQTQLNQLNLIGHLTGLPFGILIAWLVAPLTVRLLRPPDSTPAPQEARLARISTILNVFAFALLGIPVSYCESVVIQLIQPHSRNAIEGIQFAFAAFLQIPDILLAIALYLIAHPSSQLMAAHETPIALTGRHDSPLNEMPGL